MMIIIMRIFSGCVYRVRIKQWRKSHCECFHPQQCTGHDEDDDHDDDADDHDHDDDDHDDDAADDDDNDDTGDEYLDESKQHPESGFQTPVFLFTEKT